MPHLTHDNNGVVRKDINLGLERDMNHRVVSFWFMTVD